MNLRRLRYFIKIVDVGSLTQAADILHIAQPALSQQLAALEGEVKQQLLIRTKRGVTPTEAGSILYAHAQAILRQCEQAQSAIDGAGQALSGQVSVGLAPGTAASLLALPLMEEVRKQHPGILLYFNESFGTTLSELIMSGRMDMAVLYGNRQVHGLAFIPLMKEDLYLVTPQSEPHPGKTVTLEQISHLELFLPRTYNVMRKLVDDAFAQKNLSCKVKCEIESASTLALALDSNLGATILPESIARSMMKQSRVRLAKIVDPGIQAPLSFCTSDHLPLSQPAEAVKKILLSLMAERTHDNRPLTLVS